MPRQKTDVTVQGTPGASTQFIVTPVSKRARAWTEKHVQLESWQMWGAGGGFAVDHHYIQDLVLGMQADGLTVMGA